jgi:hypothetical protein
MTLDSLLTPDRIWAALGAVGMVYLVLQVTVLARARRAVPPECQSCEWLREEVNKLRPVVHQQTSSITGLNIKVKLLMRRAGLEGPAPPEAPGGP